MMSCRLITAYINRVPTYFNFDQKIFLYSVSPSFKSVETVRNKNYLPHHIKPKCILEINFVKPKFHSAISFMWIVLNGMAFIHMSFMVIRRGFARTFVNYKKGCIRLAAASDKVYQLLAQGRWFSGYSGFLHH